MRIKNVHLLYAVKAPWSTNYFDYLENRQGYEITLEGQVIVIREGATIRMVIPVTMMRSAEVVEELPVATFGGYQQVNATVSSVPAVDTWEPPKEPKRRGRPRKVDVD